MNSRRTNMSKKRFLAPEAITTCRACPFISLDLNRCHHSSRTFGTTEGKTIRESEFIPKWCKLDENVEERGGEALLDKCTVTHLSSSRQIQIVFDEENFEAVVGSRAYYLLMEKRSGGA